ncbi:MAG: hypothetical protein AB8F65_00010 [Woeseiaceae bacterium]
MRAVVFLIVASWLMAASQPSPAQTDVYVPDELEPWREWVLDGQDHRVCPFLFNSDASDSSDYVCRWPGELTLEVNATGAGFRQSWTTLADDQWLPLPGNSAAWPATVSVNGVRVPVIERGGIPAVQVTKGEHDIRGLISWQRRPGTLAVPSAIGLVKLTLDGQPVARPERNAQGIWLGVRKVSKASSDSLEAEVYRLVADDIPTFLVTQLRLDVSGSVREATTGQLLPDGFTPVLIESEIPARVEADGSLTLQVRPGYWEINVTARASSALDSVTALPQGENLPATEIWSYQRNDRLRVTAPEGLSPVDPDQSDVPGDWSDKPAYRVEAGDSLRIVERSRGKTESANRLSLSRTLWMDFDRNGFVFEDEIGGAMNTNWRLNMSAPYQLISAEADENLLVTSSENEMTGVEVRQQRVDMTATGTLSRESSMPVTGWQSRFESVEATLYLPVGTMLFAAPGADAAYGSWLRQWRLLDFFLVLITTVASMRLYGKRVAALALIVMVLTMHEFGAPVFVWLSLLVATALVRLAPAGNLQKASRWYRNFSLITLAGIFIFYAATQFRSAIYPQLDASRGAPFLSQGPANRVVYAPEVQEAAVEDLSDRVSKSGSLQEVIVTGSRIKYQRYAPETVVAVGPGLPEWTGNRYSLQWTGPVSADQSLRLVVIPRWLLSALRVFSVLLIGLLASFFVLETFNRKTPWSTGMPVTKNTGTVATVLLASLLSLANPSPAEAQSPTPELLDALQQRLLVAPDCTPQCAAFSRVSVQVSPQSLSMEMNLSAGAEVLVPLPGSQDGWHATTIEINGKRVDRTYRFNQGLFVSLTKGVNTIRLTGPLPDAESVEIPFQMRPKLATVASDEAWLVSGLNNGKLSSGSLQLARQRLETEASGKRWEPGRLPTFVRVERTIVMGLDWRVTTRVQRVAPSQGAITIDLPLLEGEQVTQEGISVADNNVRVSLAANSRATSWQSTLPKMSAFNLTAATSSSYVETWAFEIGSAWRVTFDGVPESAVSSADGVFRSSAFHPRQGESLTVTATRPAAITGETLIFDTVSLVTTIGQRSRDHKLELGYRSTRGDQYALTLPAGVRLTSVQIDGQVSPLQPRDDVLTLPVIPGEHSVNIAWQEDAAVGWSERAPTLDLGTAASNIRVDVEMPGSRWLLAVGGPAMGPAILYWSELAALLLFALVLGRIKLTPLNSVSWFLLGLGFSMFSWPSFFVIVVWLVAMGAREKVIGKLSDTKFNLLQVALGGLSFVALANIVVGLPQGLLGRPDMNIVGNGSYGNRLSWFTDHIAGVLPEVSVYSLPTWCYKALILVWALWLSFALLRWLPWAWQQFSAGDLWRAKHRVAS